MAEKRDYNLREVLAAIIGQRLVGVTQEEVEESHDLEAPSVSLMFENGWILSFDATIGFSLDTPGQGKEFENGDDRSGADA